VFKVSPIKERSGEYPAPLFSWLSMLNLLINYYHEIDNNDKIPEMKFFIPSIYVDPYLRLMQCEGRNRSRVSVKEEGLDHIPYMFKLIIAGDDISIVQDKLSKQSIYLRKSEIVNILQDPTFCGVLKMRGYVTKDVLTHKIISESVFYKVQSLLKGPLFENDIFFSKYINDTLSNLDESHVHKMACKIYRKVLDGIFQLIGFFFEEFNRLTKFLKSKRLYNYEVRILEECIKECCQYFNVLGELSKRQKFIPFVHYTLSLEWTNLTLTDRSLLEQIIFPGISWDSEHLGFFVTEQSVFFS
jgi:hypothetical protein